MGDATTVNSAGRLWSYDQGIEPQIEYKEVSHVQAMDSRERMSYLRVLRLAFQSLGVVYGDLSTSPLYVFNNIFPSDFPDYEDVMGALSLIIYSLVLIPLIKYVFVVMRANDNGEGGTFGIYSLLCCHAKVNTIPNQHHTDENLTTYKNKMFKQNSISARTTKWLEASHYRKNALLILVLFGTCMVIGDGIFTPAISVLSSVGGIKVNHPDVSTAAVVIVASIILVAIFSVQHYGTDKVGWMFAPAVLLWLISIGTIGAYNIFKHDTRVLKAFSPYYIVKYFEKGKKRSWVSLGGIMLSITGTEALFADLGHFSTLSVQIAFTTVVLPCLLLQYLGQAAYVLDNQHHVHEAFYKSIPEIVYWPVFLIATFAAIIASQASITATFSIIKQSVALGCFPRVKVLHTSNNICGQIYIPEINWVLMILCIIVTAGFSSTTQIANAYGVAVILVMLVTTILMAVVMLVVWRTLWFFIMIFTAFFLFVELVYFSSVLFKIDQGGWAPLVIATVFLVVMYVWHYGAMKKYEFEMQSKVSIAWIVGLGPSLGLVRVPGVGLLYTELVNGVPHIFSHLITHLPAIHSLVVFVSVKYLPVHIVPNEERFFVRRIGPKEFSMFRCVARYGYKDLHKRDDVFERMLLEALCAFIRFESLDEGFSDSETCSYNEETRQEQFSISGNAHTTMNLEMTSAESSHSIVSERSASNSHCPVGFLTPKHRTVDEELQYLSNCWNAGVVHILGNTMIRARKESSIVKKIAIDYIYAFLRRICREHSVIFNVPHESLLNVGQVCYV